MIKINKLMICNIKDEFVDYHCKYICFHGKVHGKDECGNKYEFCNIVNRKIKCRPLYKKELKLLERNNGLS